MLGALDVPEREVGEGVHLEEYGVMGAPGSRSPKKSGTDSTAYLSFSMEDRELGVSLLLGVFRVCSPKGVLGVLWPERRFNT